LAESERRVYTGAETGVEEEEGGGEENERDGDGQSDQMEAQGSGQLCSLSHRKRQLTSLATCFGRRLYTRPMPKIREVCRDGEACSLVCIHGENIGRRWGAWEAMDEPEGGGRK